MKRNSLTTALLAGLAGAAGLATTAQALNLNPDGLGQVLIYPYYTVQNGLNTVISIVNTTDQAKAVKVRLLEGRNSKEVLDFNLYLSPYDVWTAGLSAAGSTGPGRLITRDASCTAPIVGTPPTGTPFRNYQYSLTNIDHPSTMAATLSSLDRTREGHIEAIEMGTLATGTANTQLFEEVEHVNGTPRNCEAVRDAWRAGGGWAASRTANIGLPTGGLFGAGAIINIPDGTEQDYVADAIEAFYTDTSAPGALHFEPGNVRPALTDARTRSAPSPQVDAYTTSRDAAGVVSVNTIIVTAGTATPDAVSLVYMHDAIYNEYDTSTSRGATSEWVVTFPTKRFYVDTASPAAVVRPFTNPFRNNGSSCEEVGIAYYDREERELVGDIDVSPPPPSGAGPALCYEAQVVTFNQSAVAAGTGPSAILGSTYATNITTNGSSGVFGEGWLRMEFNDPATPEVDNFMQIAAGTGGTPPAFYYVGLPATGFWAARYVNSAAAPGVIANYASTYRHRGSRLTVTGTAPAPPASVP